MTTICAVDGCTRSAMSRGWCKPHYARWLRHGSPGGARLRPYHAAGTRCGVPGCTRPYYARGYCLAHYHRWWRTGRVGPAEIGADNSLRALSPAQIETVRALWQQGWSRRKIAAKLEIGPSTVWGITSGLRHARLIAAAPELLTACRAVVATNTDDANGACVFCDASANDECAPACPLMRCRKAIALAVLP